MSCCKNDALGSWISIMFSVLEIQVKAPSGEVWMSEM